MRRSRKTIQEAKDNARAISLGGAVTKGVGALSWWDGNVGWKGDAATVQAACKCAGLDPAATLPLPPDNKVAFGRAVDSVRASVRKHDLTLMDAAKGPNGERRVAVVQINRNGRVSLDNDQGIVVCPDDGSAPYVERRGPNGYAAEVVRMTRDYFEVYTSDDVRTAVVQLIDRWNGMACRQQTPKVLYWIPSQSVPVMLQMQDFVQAIGWGVFEVFEGKEGTRNAETVQRAVNNGLEAMLNEFSDEADQYIAKENTRASKLAGLLEDAKALQDRWHLMRNVLGAAVKSGDDRISKIESKVQARLTKIEAEKDKEAALQQKSA
jgi:hypothetical protein